MKKIMFFAALCCISVSLKAQSTNLTVINNSACDVTFFIVASDNILFPGVPCSANDRTFDQILQGTATCPSAPCSMSYTVATAPWDWAHSGGTSPWLFTVVKITNIGGTPVGIKVGDPSCTWPSTVTTTDCGGSFTATWSGTTLTFN